MLNNIKIKLFNKNWLYNKPPLKKLDFNLFFIFYFIYFVAIFFYNFFELGLKYL